MIALWLGLAFGHPLAPSVLRIADTPSGIEAERIRLTPSSAIFVVLTPRVNLELLWIRMLLTRPFRSLRTTIIAVLRKPDVEAG